MTTNSEQCQGVRKDGSPCQSPATSGGWCYWHHPDRTPEEKHATAMKGALASRPKTLPAATADITLMSPEGALVALQENASKTRRGELDPRVANSFAYQVGIAVKIWETCISDRLDRLEKLIHGRTRRR